MMKLASMQLTLPRIDFRLDSFSNLLLMISYSVILFIVIGCSAWLYEDAFITYRTIENFIDGYGLRWNVDERVQTYTHPLWMLIHIPFYAISKNFFLVGLGLSFIFSIGSCLLLLNTWKKDFSLIILGLSFITPLILSETFQRYATSGFECPLVIFLFTLFCLYAFSSKQQTPWLALSLLTALSALTRLDTILIYFPLLTYLAFQQGWKIPWKKIAAGFSPLILWQLFSLFYYGFLFPNTKYAKLNTGVALSDYIKQGWLYWIDLWNLDLVSAVVISLSLILSIALFIYWIKNRTNNDLAKSLFLHIGLFIYFLYIVRIGGDHSSLRHWMIIFYISLVLLHFTVQITIKNYDIKTKALLFFACLVVSLSTLHQVSYHEPSYQHSKIRNTHYNKTNSLDYMWNLIKNNTIHYPYWIDPALKAKRRAEDQQKPLFIFTGGIGMFGLYAGPQVIICDNPALASPLLARMPITKDSYWRPGHFRRKILPAGYQQARMHNDFSQMDEDLAIYYQKLRLVTTAPLFNFERIKTILLFNIGYYDHYLNQYLIKNKLT